VKRSPFKSRGIVWTSSEAQQAREHAKTLRIRALIGSSTVACNSVMARASEVPTNPVPPKLADRAQQKIRDSARGEDCLVRIPGICSGDPTHTIWSHAPLGAAGKGRGIKALDLAGSYCCVECDAAIDGQRPLPAGYDRAQALLDWMFGHLRSLVRLRQKGLA
jgi:hypothetical protein